MMQILQARRTSAGTIYRVHQRDHGVVCVLKSFTGYGRVEGCLSMLISMLNSGLPSGTFMSVISTLSWISNRFLQYVRMDNMREDSGI